MSFNTTVKQHPVTPVENTLTDLWSLFEFCQPGMLGPLNDFGRNYRKPIEIDSRDVEGIARLAQLRLLIEPQLLRRTKAEVAKDLPSKIIVDSFGMCSWIELLASEAKTSELSSELAAETFFEMASAPWSATAYVLN